MATKRTRKAAPTQAPFDQAHASTDDPPASATTRKKFVLELTATQLTHLRDLMGIMMNFDSLQTLSEHLAATAERPLAERRLWTKIAELCASADIGVADKAPDFAIAMSAPPQLCVTLIQEDPEE